MVAMTRENANNRKMFLLKKIKKLNEKESMFIIPTFWRSLYGEDRKACLPDWKKDEDGVGEHIYIENNAKNIFFGSIHTMRTRTSERLP
jgi:hypothetical protein